MTGSTRNMAGPLLGVFVLLQALLFLTGCENDIERINLLTDETVVPRVKGTNVKVIYSDSAKVKVQILAPSFQQFHDVETPYMEFPEGMEVYFYDDSMTIESEVRADYTIYYTQDRLWHATGNVVARRLDNGDALYTEELFWNEADKFIYSNTFTRIQNKDGTFYGKRGFESHQDLSNWKLKGTSGTVNVTDEE
jgi:LPS export ABC transporter protein LptC